MKFCSSCNLLKSESEFSKGKKERDGLHYHCKECNYVRHLRLTYNISEAAYAEMLERADGSCESCGEVFTERPCVDHDHNCCDGPKSCGRCVRGLLCRRCNFVLGYLEKSPERLDQVQDYAARYSI